MRKERFSTPLATIQAVAKIGATSEMMWRTTAKKCPGDEAEHLTPNNQKQQLPAALLHTIKKTLLNLPGTLLYY